MAIIVNNCTQPTASFTVSSMSICAGQTITFVDNSTGGITNWNWTFNGGTPGSANTQGSHVVTYFTAGTFNVTLQVSNSNGADDTSMTVTVNPKPQVTFLTTDDNCKESSGNITGIVTLGSYPVTFNWNNGSTDSTLSNLTSGTYSVLITDNNGCMNTEQVIINDLQEGCDYFVYVPNVFTPNGDGNNDIFYVRGKGIRSMNLEIFNRWGNKVFESSNIEVGWDGKFGGAEQNSAVFVYVISAVLENGKKVEESGNISIIK
ncbi:MAG: gliding motility-associated C-terminal domain-containing protein [Bacteroidetes bacterium]|nr:gliding motility-associated C-terminal domain-containing protein [Bacteroidota bacterium]